MSADLFCAIPARGGSDRLPRKNVLPLHGRPLIEYSIAAAAESGRFDAVYVCTDDEEIAAAARRGGAQVPALVPADLAGPLVPSHRPCQWMHEHLGLSAETLVCLQPTSPLCSAADIRAAVDRFRRGDVDFVVSVTPIDPHYFHWAVVPGDGSWRLYFGERFLMERPLLPPVFRPNGAVKIARLAALQRWGHFFGARLGVVEMPEERAVHVATRTDLLLCEALLGGRP